MGISSSLDAYSIPPEYTYSNTRPSNKGCDLTYPITEREKSRATKQYQELFLCESKNPGRWTIVSEIESDIFLGGLDQLESDLPDAQSMDPHKAPHFIMSSLDIQNIISITSTPMMWNYGPGVTSKNIIIDDHQGEDIAQYFWEVIENIEQARHRGDKTFIHCQMGRSRSVTCLAAYYLYKGRPGENEGAETGNYVNLGDVMRFIKSKRDDILPNMYFFIQLRRFANYLKDQTDEFCC